MFEMEIDTLTVNQLHNHVSRERRTAKWECPGPRHLLNECLQRLEEEEEQN